MNKRVWLFGSLTALVACLAAAEACVLDRGGTCEEPGGCVRGAVGNAGPGGAGLGGGQAASCEGHADCEDWNPCTIDTCDVAGVCRTVDVGTGEVVGGTSCMPLVCDGGGPVEQAQPAGTPCDGGGVHCGDTCVDITTDVHNCGDCGPGRVLHGRDRRVTRALADREVRFRLLGVGAELLAFADE